MSTAHAARKQAEHQYNVALAVQRAAESISEATYLAAKAALEAARKELCEAELLYPTTKEAASAANTLRLRNRGFDC